MRGFCSYCGGRYAVFGNGTRIARHGFSRHHGRECRGSRRPPAVEVVGETERIARSALQAIFERSITNGVTEDTAIAFDAICAIAEAERGR